MWRAALFTVLMAVPASADCVVLLHGLARKQGSLVPMAAKAAGYSFQQLVLAILQQAQSARG